MSISVTQYPWNQIPFIVFKFKLYYISPKEIFYNYSHYGLLLIQRKKGDYTIGETLIRYQWGRSKRREQLQITEKNSWSFKEYFLSWKGKKWTLPLCNWKFRFSKMYIITKSNDIKYNTDKIYLHILKTNCCFSIFRKHLSNSKYFSLLSSLCI